MVAIVAGLGQIRFCYMCGGAGGALCGRYKRYMRNIRYMGTTKPKAGESLAELFPDVASEWHPTLNGDLTPKEVTRASNKKFMWKCDKGPDHVWEASVNNRTRRG